MNNTGSRPNKKPRALRRIAAVLLIAAMGLFIYYTPAYSGPRLYTDHFEEWIEQHGEPAVGMIEIWHVVKFKPYIGSLGSWLDKAAAKCYSRYIGVYYKVRSVTDEEAASLAERGLKPDVISFSHGSVPITSLQPMSSLPDDAAFSSGIRFENCYALPYCSSGLLLLYTPEAASQYDISDLERSAGTAEDFKAGKAASCVTDIRGAGDLDRAQLAGKCPYFEAVRADSETPLVQYIGLSSNVSDAKRPYCEELMRYITGETAQQSLSAIGLIPILPGLKVHYDRKWLESLYTEFDPYSIPPCF